MFNKIFKITVCLLLLTVMPTLFHGQETAGEILSPSQIKSKVNEFKENYPPFQFERIKNEAERKYYSLRPGQKVTLSRKHQQISGTYYGNENGKLSVGGQIIFLKEIPESKRHLFDENLARKKREEYLREKLEAYNRTRLAAITNYENKLTTEAELASRIKEIKPESTTETPLLHPVFPNGRYQASKSPSKPRFAIVTEVIKLTGREIPPGEVIIVTDNEDFKEVQCRTLGNAEVFRTVRDNLFVIDRAVNIGDALSLSQAAFRFWRQNQETEAVYYAYLAEKLNKKQRRSYSLKIATDKIKKFLLMLKYDRERISSLNRDLRNLETSYKSNQRALQDDWAVKAGTIDKSEYYQGRISEKQKELKELADGESRSFNKLCRYVLKDIKKHCEQGDYVAACLMADYFNSKLPLLEKACGKDGISSGLAKDIAREIESSFKDEKDRKSAEKVKSYIEAYERFFGQGNTRFYLPEPEFDALAEAAVSSLSHSRAYEQARFTNDFKKQLYRGIKILYLLPRAPAAVDMRRELDREIKEINRQTAEVKKLFEAKKLAEAMKICEQMNTLPNELKPVREKISNDLVNSRSFHKLAMKSEKEDRYGSAMNSIKQSLELWPGNQEAQEYYRDFMNKHSEICHQCQIIGNYLEKHKYREAADICDVLFKELPAYRNYLTGIKKRINQIRRDYDNKLEEADNYFYQGQIYEAYELYKGLGYKEGLQKCLDSIYENDPDKSLEKLTQWGKAERERRLLGSSKGNLTSSELFKKCSSSVVMVKINGAVAGSGFAVSGDGLIITCKNFVSANPEKIMITNPGWSGLELSAKIIKIAPKRNLALLKISYSFKRPLELRDDNISAGNVVYVLGAENKEGAFSLGLKEGMVRSVNQNIKGVACLKTTVPVNSLNRGGPLLDGSGKVIGVGDSTLSGEGQGTSFAISASEIKRAFEKYVNQTKGE
jgi:hypothetical protein